MGSRMVGRSAVSHGASIDEKARDKCKARHKAERDARKKNR